MQNLFVICMITLRYLIDCVTFVNYLHYAFNTIYINELPLLCLCLSLLRNYICVAILVSDVYFSYFSFSRAILQYLCNKYCTDANQHLYPKEPELRGTVDRLLFFDMGTLTHAYKEYFVSTNKPTPVSSIWYQCYFFYFWKRNF